MQLYSYFRSSASFRVRIALALKGLPYDYVPVQIVHNEQFGAAFDALAPSHLVPLLKDGDAVVNQSLAIIEYLDETHPEPPLLPGDALARAQIRALAQDIACEIHPLNNLRVLHYLTGTLGVSSEQKDGWYRYWVDVGLEALETQLAREAATGHFCHGDAPSLADLCLVPQIANARRFSIDLSPYATLTRIEAACLALPAFATAAPERQPDAE
jgi:maleylacetoacetate isomerase